MLVGARVLLPQLSDNAPLQYLNRWYHRLLQSNVVHTGVRVSSDRTQVYHYGVDACHVSYALRFDEFHSINANT